MVELEILNLKAQAIEQTAEDGATLIEKLQRYIRQDTEKHFERVDLPTLIEDCITITQPYWYNEPRRQGIEIEVERALDEVPDVMGAPSELREVFVNLILNAVQAMPEVTHLRLQRLDDVRRERVGTARRSGGKIVSHNDGDH